MPKIKISAIYQTILYAFLLGSSLIVLPSNNEGGASLFGRFVQLIVIFFACCLVAKRLWKKNIETDIFALLVHIFFLYVLLISVWFQVTNTKAWLYQWILIMILLLSANVYWKSNPKESFHILSWIGSVLVYFNALLVLIYPEGLYESENGAARYMFGNYNVIGAVSLLAITFQGVYTELTGKGTLNLWLLFFVSVSIVLFLGSMTSAVGLAIMGSYMLFRKRIKHPYRIIIPFLIIYILFLLMIVIGGSSIEDFSLATSFIENILGKDTTFTQRTVVWYENLAFIVQRPVTGWGYIDMKLVTEWSGAIGSHNLFLAILLYGGIIGFSIFAILLCSALLAALKHPNKVTHFTTTSLSVLLLMSMFEQYPFIIVFGIIITTWYARYFQLLITKR